MCRGVATSQSGAGIVAPGAYFTSINVHNPNKEAVDIEKLFDIALPARSMAAESPGR